MSDQRTALVLGATGLVGRALCAELAKDTTYAEVHALVRRAPEGLPEGIRVHVMAFGDLAAAASPPLPPSPPLPAVDDVFCALGTTIAQAGSRDAFRAIDHGMVLECARRARAAGAERFALVSALGANPRARVYYSRIKGEVERDLATLGYRNLVIARPSFLAGERHLLGQRPRPGESVALTVLSPFAALLPRRYRPIHARAVAHALVATMKTVQAPLVVLESEVLQGFAPPRP